VVVVGLCDSTHRRLRHSRRARVDEAAAALGAEFDGVLVRDGWAPYRQFRQAAHQTCLAHLIRRCREIADAHPRTAWPCHVQAVLQDALDVRDRVAAGEISAHGTAVARGHLLSGLMDLLAAPGTVPDCQRLAAHLTTELPAVFGFLFDSTLDATNWRAEQALRPAVVNRKVSGGNRSERGAETQEILGSIVQIARLRDLDPHEMLVDLLRSPQPTVSPSLSSLL
jgi:transposase